MLSADIVCFGGAEYVCVVSGASSGSGDATIRPWTLSEGEAKPMPASSLTNTVRN